MDYSQHKFLLLPPLVLIIVFCFGLVTMDDHNATTANQAKANSGSQQQQLSPPQNLPTMTPAAESSPSAQASSQASSTSSTPAQSSPSPAPHNGGQQLQSAVPNNQASSVPIAPQLLNSTLKTVTENLPLF